MELEFLAQLGFEPVAPEPINQPGEPFSHGVLRSTKNVKTLWTRRTRRWRGGSRSRPINRMGIG